MDHQLSVQNNGLGDVAACWLEANNKEKFDGSSFSHSTKQEVLKVDICAACDDILNMLNSITKGNPCSNWNSSSQLAFDLLKIFQTQLNTLEDEVENLYTEVILPKTVKKIKKEKITKKSEDVNGSVDYLQEIPDIDLEEIFPQDKVYRNLLKEEITFAPIQADVLSTGFGDTDEVDETMVDTFVTNTLPAASNKERNDNASSRQPKLTTKTLLKRKYREAREDENPTKRKRVY